MSDDRVVSVVRCRRTAGTLRLEYHPSYRPEEGAVNDCRKIHFVGSLPPDLDSPAKAMEFVKSTAGEFFDGLMPGGEAYPERATWYVRPITDRFAEHPAVELVRRGDWSGVAARNVYRVRAGHSLREADLEEKLGYLAETLAALPAFESIKTTMPGVRFKVAVPSPFVLSFIAFDRRALLFYSRSAPRGERVFPWYKPLVEASVRQITRIHDRMGGDVVFQLELPGETALCAMLPAPMRRLVAHRTARAVSSIVAQTPHRARIGIHLCYGSLNNMPATVPRSTAGVVTLANAIARYWPTGRHLDFIHLPMADGPHPPLEPNYYTPLGRLSLPADTRVVAGISHAHQSLDVQRQALDLAEDAVGHTLDIAAPCGLGRYPDADTARAVVKHSVTLAQKSSTV